MLTDEDEADDEELEEVRRRPCRAPRSRRARSRSLWRATRLTRTLRCGSTGVLRRLLAQGLFDDDEFGAELRLDGDDEEEGDEKDDSAAEEATTPAPAAPAARKGKPAPPKRKVDRKDVRCGGAVARRGSRVQCTAGRQARQGDHPVRRGARARAA